MSTMQWVFTVIILAVVASGLIGCSRRPNSISKEEQTILVRDENGRALTRAEVEIADGTFHFEIVGGESAPPEARRLHEEAREAGGKGDYVSAIDLLNRSSALAPQWPYPVYDRAYTHLLMQNVDLAREDYRRVVDLSPRGYFTAITALDTLERERTGQLPTGTYQAYLSLEWIHDPARRSEAVHKLATQIPQFAPVWKDLADLAENDGDKLRYIETGLAAHPDAETKGILEINKAILLSHKGDRERAVRNLGHLALDPQSTYATEQMAKFTLANITKSH